MDLWKSMKHKIPQLSKIFIRKQQRIWSRNEGYIYKNIWLELIKNKCTRCHLRYFWKIFWTCQAVSSFWLTLNVSSQSDPTAKISEKLFSLENKKWPNLQIAPNSWKEIHRKFKVTLILGLLSAFSLRTWYLIFLENNLFWRFSLYLRTLASLLVLSSSNTGTSPI